MRQKTYGPPFLMLGLDLNNIDSSNFAVNMSARVLHYGLLGVGSETRLDFVIGTNQRVAAEVVKPLGSTPFFVAPRLYFDRRGRNLYMDDVLRRRVSDQEDGCRPRYRDRLRAERRGAAGLRRGGLHRAPPCRRARLAGSRGYRESTRTSTSVIDTQTSPIVPTRGFRLRSTLRQYFSAPTAERIRLTTSCSTARNRSRTGEVRTSWFRRVRDGGDRLFLIGEGGTSFGEDPLVNDFTLGGPLRLGSFNNDQLRGDNYLLFGGGYLRGVGRMPDVLGGNIFLGAWVEGGSAFNDWDIQDWKSDITGGAILETLLGPVFLGGSVGFQGGGRFYISLGPFFQ